VITPLNLSAGELQAWREIPLTRAFLAWLEESIASYQRAIPKYIVRNKLDEAKAASGALEGYEEILAALTEESAKPIEEVEEVFIDPASRPSTRETA
jgi:regulatory protein YycH of two-component signal transduction system YycFG